MNNDDVHLLVAIDIPLIVIEAILSTVPVDEIPLGKYVLARTELLRLRAEALAGKVDDANNYKRAINRLNAIAGNFTSDPRNN